MVYINSRGEIIDETRVTPSNIFWKIYTFIVTYFKTLIGIEDVSMTHDGKVKDPKSGRGSGGFFGGGGGGGGSSGRPGDSNYRGPRKFGPRGFKSVTDLAPSAPPTCSGGACG